MQAGVPDEKVTIDGDTDRLDFKGGGCGAWGEGALPHARDQRGHVLQLEVEVRGAECLRVAPPERDGRGTGEAQADVRGSGVGEPGAEGSARKKT